MVSRAKGGPFGCQGEGGFATNRDADFLGILRRLPELIVLRYDWSASQAGLQVSVNRSVTLLPRLLISINFG